MDAPNYYDILEVVPHASPEVIRAAYKSLMQRHHPDRHPAHSGAASRASAIAQAYAVLSDPGQRAAYDARLQQLRRPPLPADPPRPQPAAPRRPSAAPTTAPSNGYLWLLAAVILASGGLMKLLSGPTPAPPPAALAVPQRPDIPARSDTTTVPAQPAEAPPPTLRRVALLAADLNVVLLSTDPGAESSRHRLSIPAVELVIGSIESDKFTESLARQKEQVVQKLADKLAHAAYSELQIDGDRYLVPFILEALREITGTQGLDEGAAANPTATIDTHRYGIVAVVLPVSFGLR
ncbi:chaperone protein DnaJ [Comamonadaceae bacterium OS-1]|nr:chaperone protein DnaJ [Comamonadaceae bacterium OS-1]